ncbi:DNA polymerase III psi subunit [Rufibacter quisquiliarum]|uniref:DNA polymerase III psi subunit n=1 Tax=Rufibacter quisquiliarum TaxID=1549639 RepID=A0A839GT66_9BACT|nr:DNA polymerase III psi subunit [Rufibacter quisquiliarum]
MGINSFRLNSRERLKGELALCLQGKVMHFAVSQQETD